MPKQKMIMNPLKDNLKAANDAHLKLQHKCEEAINDNDTCYRTIKSLEEKLTGC